jgi:ketosteroid isomerase-like protein
LAVTTYTHGDAQDLLAEYKRAWQGRDPDLMLELFSDDAEYRVDPFEQPLVGANAIRAHWNGIATAQANVEFDAERIWLAGATVLASWHAAFTRRASGERVRQRGFMTLELDDQRRVTRLRTWTIERMVGTDSTFRPEQAAEVADGR